MKSSAHLFEQNTSTEFNACYAQMDVCIIYTVNSSLQFKGVVSHEKNADVDGVMSCYSCKTINSFFLESLLIS